MQLKWTDLANIDLDKIEEHLARQNNPSVAIGVVQKVVDTTCLILANHPQAGRLGRLKGTRELVIDGLPFIVVYRQMSALNQLQILRMIHDAQLWPAAD